MIHTRTIVEWGIKIYSSSSSSILLVWLPARCVRMHVHARTHTHIHMYIYTGCPFQKVACAVQLVHLNPQKMFELQVKIAVSPVLSERMPLLC